MNRLLVAPRTLMTIAGMWMLSLTVVSGAQASSGEENFNKLCGACHTIGGGKRVGPDLQGVRSRRSEEWLVKWIKTPQAMVNSGDPDAVALFNEYKIPMPDTALSDAEIKDVLGYIAGGGASAGAGAVQAAAPVAPPTPEDIEAGRAYFQGSKSLKNGGPSCNACHHVAHDAIVGGGVLAKSLTEAVSRLGVPGVNAILSSPPFPVMQQAYAIRPLEEREIVALTAYLQNVGEHPQLYDQPREDSMKLLLGGVGGLGVLMGLYSFIWRQRKPGPVNQKVFDRQVRSQ